MSLEAMIEQQILRLQSQRTTALANREESEEKIRYHNERIAEQNEMITSCDQFIRLLQLNQATAKTKHWRLGDRIRWRGDNDMGTIHALDGDVQSVTIRTDAGGSITMRLDELDRLADHA